jgi:hypothetical protein
MDNDSMDFGTLDEVFSRDGVADGHGPTLKRPRRKKTLKQQLVFYAANAFVLPAVALCHVIVGAEGLRAAMPVMALPLHRLPVPGAGLLRQYDGWDRITLSMTAGFLLFVAVTWLWGRVFAEVQGCGTVAARRKSHPLFFYLAASVAGIVLVFDTLLFCLGLAAQSDAGWSTGTPWYVAVAAGLLYMAALAMLGAWHSDYHHSSNI